MDTRSERPPISQDNYPAADDLFPAETLDDAAIRRIRDVLSAPSWRWLTTTVRDAWGRNLSRRRISIDLSALSDAEAAAIADFFRWPTHRSGITTISLTRLDALLRASGLSAGLAACLTATGGPLHDEAGRRRADKAALRAANDELWAEAAVHPAFQRHPPLEAWLADERRTGRLPADLPVRRHVLFDALSVLAALPDPGTGLARFATRILGNAHALDDGSVQATVLRALAWLSDQQHVPPGAARRRALWASAGVALDTVSSTVLALALTLPGRGPVVTTLAANAEVGIPVRSTLGQIRHYLDVERIESVGAPASVFVCENPSVIETAAEVLGPRSAPLICVEGRPSVAAGLLLQELRDAGSVLRYDGDFDWPGLAIAQPLLSVGVLPWRFDASDYRRGLTGNRRLKRLPLPSSPVATPWDSGLAAAMMEHRIAIEEEAVIDDLLSDLSLDDE
jgi:uncharacterized protein (TIGR02679 family)